MQLVRIIFVIYNYYTMYSVTIILYAVYVHCAVGSYQGSPYTGRFW